MQDPVAVRNFLALKKKSYDIKFDLENTNYEAIEKIGSGAYGVVCSAIHKKTNEKVAIKKIPNIFEQITIAKRTYREIKILKHFKHDNIISILEIIGPTETTSPMNDIYIVLDLMESDLHRIIHSSQELSEEHLKYFLFQLLRGLKYIHSANVLHRDLKPSNLLINENCELKIGDFGMARGVLTQPDNGNYSMTSYVATRWYRAPELLMLRQSYTAAVDVWSVGCIFAEMLTRKQLFPGHELLMRIVEGHDYIHQLKLIFGALGRPSEKFLCLAPPGIVKDFLKGLGPKNAVPMETLFPKASRKARDLISKMLTMDAPNRISVTKALNHPFLSKYHDPDDEPICIPVFDFEFERQELNTEQLKEVIVSEIKDYHQVAVPLLTFDLHPVVSPERQMAAPLGNDVVGMPLSTLSVSESSLALSRDILPPMQGAELFSRYKTSAISNAEHREEKLPHVQLEATRTITDVEMLSGKLLELNMQDESLRVGGACNRGAELRVTGDATELRDVIMLSAKAKTLSAEVRTRQIDTKALIKAALLGAELRRQQQESSTSSETGRPVTAMQRQREREEKRRRKMERAKEKRKQKKQKDKKSTFVLSDEDRSLLERWKGMQHRDQPTTGRDATADCAFPEHATVAQSVTETAIFREASDQLRQHLTNMTSLDLDKSTVTPSLAEPQPEQGTIQDTVDRSSISTTGHLPSYHEAVQAQFMKLPESDGTPFLSIGSFDQGRSLDTSPNLPKRDSDVRLAVSDDKSVPCPDELPTLVCTPKGTGSGYGVGLDLDGLLHDAVAEQKHREREGLDSAPLSASLIADWLEVSGNMNIHDIEAALQQELDISSPILKHISP